MSASKNKKPVVERLFYTFGSIFLAAMVVVCGINFKKDGRALQSAFLPADAAASAGQATAGTAKASNSSASKTSTKSSAKTSAAASSNTSTAASSSKSTTNQQTVVAEP